ncbi:MAG: HAD family phosphatase [Gammaproteobacteria bacterium]|nr:HAD family phosphatase [Gammaproteobacteria bacterium]
MNHFEAIIFDMDGLLLDSEIIGLKTFQQTCEEFNLEDKTDLFIQCIGTNSEATKNILSNGLGLEVDFVTFWGICRSKYHAETKTKAIPLKQGVIDLLQHIKSLQLPVAVATSTHTEFALTKLGNAGIVDFFDMVIGGEQVRNSKPKPDIYLKAVEQLNVEPSNCLALEDSENGVKSALAAGLTVIQIPDLVTPSCIIEQNHHIILDSLSEVPDYQFNSLVI